MSGRKRPANGLQMQGGWRGCVGRVRVGHGVGGVQVGLGLRGLWGGQRGGWSCVSLAGCLAGWMEGQIDDWIRRNRTGWRLNHQQDGTHENPAAPRTAQRAQQLTPLLPEFSPSISCIQHIPPCLHTTIFPPACIFPPAAVCTTEPYAAPPRPQCTHPEQLSQLWEGCISRQLSTPPRRHAREAAGGWGVHDS